MSDAGDPLLTVAQVAARLKVSAQTVRRLARLDRLRPITVGRGMRFRPETVQAYLDQRSTTTTTIKG